MDNSSQKEPYQLDRQIGYLLRLANQRHLEIFSELLPELTPTQFSVLVKLHEVSDLSQNELGRQVGMDAATTNGVIERLNRKALIQSKTDQNDRRRLRISLTAKGRSTIRKSIVTAKNITNRTLKGLSTREAQQLENLLVKLQQD